MGAQIYLQTSFGAYHFGCKADWILSGTLRCKQFKRSVIVQLTEAAVQSRAHALRPHQIRLSSAFCVALCLLSPARWRETAPGARSPRAAANTETLTAVSCTCDKQIGQADRISVTGRRYSSNLSLSVGYSETLTTLSEKQLYVTRQSLNALAVSVAVRKADGG